MRTDSNRRLTHYFIVLIIILVSATADSFIHPLQRVTKLGGFTMMNTPLTKPTRRASSQTSFYSPQTNIDGPKLKDGICVKGGGIDGSNEQKMKKSSLLNKLTNVVSLPTLLISTLVLHKCGTDVLSHYTRTNGVPYSATTVAVLGEFIKVM
jgi:hypothetical protein